MKKKVAAAGMVPASGIAQRRTENVQQMPMSIAALARPKDAWP
jgi:hypothetical protein